MGAEAMDVAITIRLGDLSVLSFLQGTRQVKEVEKIGRAKAERLYGRVASRWWVSQWWVQEVPQRHVAKSKSIYCLNLWKEPRSVAIAVRLILTYLMCSNHPRLLQTLGSSTTAGPKLTMPSTGRVSRTKAKLLGVVPGARVVQGELSLGMAGGFSHMICLTLWYVLRFHP